MRSLLLGLAVALVACGGKIDEGALDGSTDASTNDVVKNDVITGVDVIAPTDVVVPPKPDSGPPIACGGKTGQGYVGSNGECGEIDEWKCSDGNVYEISCKCPPDPSGQTCACRKNGITTQVFGGPVCPGCTGVVKAAAKCGFPE